MLMLVMTQEQLLAQVPVNGVDVKFCDWRLEYSPSRIIREYSIRRPSYEDLFDNPGLGLLLMLKVANDPDNTHAFGLTFAPWTLSMFEHHVAEWLIQLCTGWQHVDV
jgi:hypothetical protein